MNNFKINCKHHDKLLEENKNLMKPKVNKKRTIFILFFFLQKEHVKLE